MAARARDPDAPDAGDDSPEAANREPPSLFWRVFSVFCYLVPWIDSISLGRLMYAKFRNLLPLYFVPGEACSRPALGACSCGLPSRCQLAAAGALTPAVHLRPGGGAPSAALPPPRRPPP